MYRLACVLVERRIIDALAYSSSEAGTKNVDSAIAEAIMHDNTICISFLSSLFKNSIEILYGNYIL